MGVEGETMHPFLFRIILVRDAEFAAHFVALLADILRQATQAGAGLPDHGEDPLLFPPDMVLHILSQDREARIV